MDGLLGTQGFLFCPGPHNLITMALVLPRQLSVVVPAAALVLPWQLSVVIPAAAAAARRTAPREVV